MSDLPKGWAPAKLGEVSLVHETLDPRWKPEEEFDYIDIGSIDNKTQTISEPKRILGADAPSRARRVVKEGDVLFSTVRTYLKNIAVVPANLDGAYTSTGIAVLRAGYGVDPSFLFRWVTSDDFITEISKSQDGTLYPAVTDKDVYEAGISLAPLPEQRRIVAKVDGLTARTARARKELDRIPTLIARYKQRLLALAFSGELTVGWRELHGLPKPSAALLADVVAVPVRNGLSVRGSDNPPGVRALRLSALRGAEVNLDDIRYLPISPEKASRFLLSEGDILISRGNGTRAFVGIGSRVPELAADTIFPDTAFRIRLTPALAAPRWFVSIWNSPQVREQIEKAAKTTAGIWKVAQSDLARIKLRLPSIEEQTEIVRRIESAFGWLDRMAADHAAAARLLPKLNAAILAKAFRGELVPQDPNDEAANALLARIRAERSAAPMKGRGRNLASATDKAASPRRKGRPKKGTAMRKSRKDADVMGQPYLTKLVRDMGGKAAPNELYAVANLDMVDFYQQLSLEHDSGWLEDDNTMVKAV